jgi:hypothetical protein
MIGTGWVGAMFAFVGIRRGGKIKGHRDIDVVPGFRAGSQERSE